MLRTGLEHLGEPEGDAMLDYNERQDLWDTWRELNAWDEPNDARARERGPASGPVTTGARASSTGGDVAPPGGSEHEGEPE